ncbi:MAG: hypothetical protein HGB19_02340, partial [Chlorobiales bacterium]|nr:hypothetical protein [Chlorobiales bacterium]
MKKVLFLIAALTLGFLWSSVAANAQTATPPSAGDGSPGKPYEIATLDNLYWLSQNNKEWGKYYKQTTDIKASPTSTWNKGVGFSPIGNSNTNFTGVYDGGGFAIDGLTIVRPAENYIGLFGYTNGATVKALGLTNVSISGNSFNGGLVGWNQSSTIYNSYSTGSVTGSTGSNCVGGLVGWNTISSTVLNCYSTASATGGIASNWTGGLVGFNDGNSIVSNSYSTGSVAGGARSQRTGGLVGENQSATVLNCYSVGSVSGVNEVGGLIGRNTTATVTASFWDTQTSGQTASPGGGTGKTTAEMKTQATFKGWNFTSTWQISEAKTYPTLLLLPILSGVSATNVTSSSATLNGTINPNGYETTYYFEWGTKRGTYPNSSSVQSAGGGIADSVISQLLSALSGSTTYYYRLVAKNQKGTIAGTEQSFTTLLAPPGVPSLTSPADGATGVSSTPTLSWGSVTWAAGYELQVSTVSNFATTVVNQTSLTATSYAVTPALNAGTQYYWRVLAKNAAGSSAYSTVRNFTTLAPPPVPSLTSPANGATGVSSTLTLSWGAVTGATGYELQVSAVSNFATTVVNQTGLTATSYAVTPALNAGTQYYWRVLAKNAAGSSAYSTVRNFTTLAPPPDKTLTTPQN